MELWRHPEELDDRKQLIRICTPAGALTRAAGWWDVSKTGQCVSFNREYLFQNSVGELCGTLHQTRVGPPPCCHSVGLLLRALVHPQKPKTGDMWLWFLDRQASWSVHYKSPPEENPGVSPLTVEGHALWGHWLGAPFPPVVSTGKVVFAVQYNAQRNDWTKTSSGSPTEISQDLISWARMSPGSWGETAVYKTFAWMSFEDIQAKAPRFCAFFNI